MKRSTRIENKNIMLSVIIIAKNEEKKIDDCLKSIVWADEIVLVDNNSTDKTVEIARRYGAKIYPNIKGNYSDLRNFGLSKAQGKWILYIDADERVTKELESEIRNLIETTADYEAYAIPRKNIVLGAELKHGGFGKFDYVKRLFLKESLAKWSGELHEEPNYYFKGKLTIGKDGELGHLTNKLVHIKAQTISEMIEKTNKWSAVEAKLMFEANHPPMNIPRFVSAMTREFWFRMIVEKAFLDGTPGFVHGIYQIFSRFLSYSKLWEMQVNRVVKISDNKKLA